MAIGCMRWMIPHNKKDIYIYINILNSITPGYFRWEKQFLKKVPFVEK
jgi:hypothetical protein